MAAHLITWALVHSLWIGMLFWLLTRVVTSLSPQAASRRLIRIATLLLFPLAIAFALYSTNQVSSNQQVWLLVQAEGMLSDTPGWTEQAYHWISSNSRIISTVWLLGLLIGSWRFVQGHRLLRRYHATAIPCTEQDLVLRLNGLTTKLRISRKVQLLTSALVNSPMTTGMLKPVIYLPLGLASGFSTDELEAILQHELAHIKRHDYAVNCLLVLLETIFFFNPMVLLMVKELRQEMEYACDDLVIQNSNFSTYGRALLKLQEMSLSSQIAMAARNNNSQFKKRIERMINSNNTNPRPQWSIVIIALVCLMAGSAFIAPKTNNEPLAESVSLQDLQANQDTLFFKSSEALRAKFKEMGKDKFMSKVIMLNGKPARFVLEASEALKKSDDMMEEIHDELIKDGIIGEHKSRITLMFQYSDVLNGKASLGEKYEKYKDILNRYFPVYDSYATTRAFSYPKPEE